MKYFILGIALSIGAGVVYAETITLSDKVVTTERVQDEVTGIVTETKTITQIVTIKFNHLERQKELESISEKAAEEKAIIDGFASRVPIVSTEPARFEPEPILILP